MQRDLNFFSVYKTPLGAPARGRFSLAGIAAVGLCATAVLGFFFFFQAEIRRNRVELAGIQAYLSAGDVVQAQSKVNGARGKAAALAQYAAAASSQVERYRSTVRPGSPSLRGILQAAPARTEVESLTYGGGVLTISCVSADAFSPALYTRALKAKGYADAAFSEVSRPQNANAAGYVYKIALSLNGGAAP